MWLTRKVPRVLGKSPEVIGEPSEKFTERAPGVHPGGVPGGPQAPGGPREGIHRKGAGGTPRGSPGILGIPWGEFTESPLGVPSWGVSSGSGGTPQRSFGEFPPRLMVLSNVLMIWVDQTRPLLGDKVQAGPGYWNKYPDTLLCRNVAVGWGDARS